MAFTASHSSRIARDSARRKPFKPKLRSLGEKKKRRKAFVNTKIFTQLIILLALEAAPLYSFLPKMQLLIEKSALE
jgi:hypothetical protein